MTPGRICNHHHPSDSGSVGVVAAAVTLRAAGSVTSPSFGIVVSEVPVVPCVLAMVDFGISCPVLWAQKLRHLQFISVVFRAGLGEWLPSALFAHLQNGHGKDKSIEFVIHRILKAGKDL